jgi:hypothetical protein
MKYKRRIRSLVNSTNEENLSENFTSTHGLAFSLPYLSNFLEVGEAHRIYRCYRF